MAFFIFWLMMVDNEEGLKVVKKVTLKVSNLTCRHCIEAVNNTVKGLPGILSVTIQAEADPSDVFISYESENVSFEKIRGSIIELGYPVNGYIIHEHSHSHGKVVHKHPHKHGNASKEHSHQHDS